MSGVICALVFVSSSSYHIWALFLLSFPSAQHKEFSRAQAGRLENIDQCLCDRDTVRLLQQADLGIGHGIQGGIAHERWAKKASEHLFLWFFFLHGQASTGITQGSAFAMVLSINDGWAKCMLLGIFSP